MTQIQNQSPDVIRNWRLGFIWNLACLREAPPARALCGGQALRRRQGFGYWNFI